MNMKNGLKFIVDRLREPATWRGVILLVTAFGLTISPEQQEAIVATGLAVAGLVAVLTKG